MLYILILPLSRPPEGICEARWKEPRLSPVHLTYESNEGCMTNLFLFWPHAALQTHQKTRAICKLLRQKRPQSLVLRILFANGW